MDNNRFLPAPATTYKTHDICSYHTRVGFVHFCFYVEFLPVDSEPTLPHGEHIYAAAKSADNAIEMIKEHFKSINVAVKDIVLFSGGDFVRQKDPSRTLGFKKAVVIKTHRAQDVLEMMGAFEDGGDRYQEFVRLVADKSGVTTKQLNSELDFFV